MYTSVQRSRLMVLTTLGRNSRIVHKHIIIIIIITFPRSRPQWQFKLDLDAITNHDRLCTSGKSDWYYMTDDEQDSNCSFNLHISPGSIYDRRQCIECRVMQNTLLSVTSYPRDTRAIAVLLLLYHFHSLMFRFTAYHRKSNMNRSYHEKVIQTN